MKKAKVLRVLAWMIFFVACAMYMVVNTQVYAVKVSNTKLEKEIENYQKENSDLLIELTNLSSREQLMRTFPNLKINDNIYYLKEAGNNDEKNAESETSET